MRPALRTAMLLAAVLLVVTGGNFAGAWLWQARQAHQVQAVGEAAGRDQRSPRGVQREAVKRWLHDQDAAQFRNDRPALRGGPGVWCGEVNSRNRLGGQAGFTRYVAVLDEVRESPVLDQVHFEPVARPELAAAFEHKWRLHCEP